MTAVHRRLGGAFADGYTPTHVDWASVLVWRLYGLVLVAVWDHGTAVHVHGGSDLGVLEGGYVHECPELAAWLTGAGPPPTTTVPGDVIAELGALVWGPGRNLIYADVRTGKGVSD